MAEYCHVHAVHGLTDVIEKLPEKEKEYNKYLSEFIGNIYHSISGDKPYFIDKVPRYYFIIPEIADLFPDAKFIFIFRNPVQVYASTMATWGNSKFSVFNRFGNYFDVSQGPGLLAEGYKLLKDKSYALQYEKFITDPELYTREIMNYLELEYDPELIKKFDPSKLEGRHVDPNVLKYGSKIETSNPEKWKQILNSSFRKRVITNYIKEMNDDVLELMGYDKSVILKEIKELKANGHHSLIRDIIDYNFSKLKNRYNRLSYA